eukprot:2751311-Alexandrium_andersonii.AAC.1
MKLSQHVKHPRYSLGQALKRLARYILDTSCARRRATSPQRASIQTPTGPAARSSDDRRARG